MNNFHPSLAQYAKYAHLLGGGGTAGFARDSRLVQPGNGRMRQAIDAQGFGGLLGGMQGLDAATAGGLAYLQSELELRDPTLFEPLTSVTYFRDIEMNNGGGWTDYTSNFFVTYGMSGPNQYGFVANKTSRVTSVQADVTKEVYPVTNWANEMIVSYVDMQKISQVGRSLDAMYEDGIRLNWAKSLDLTTYNGWGANAGLLNNSNVTRITLPNGGSGTQWSTKTPVQILADVNLMLNNTWTASNFDVTGMANKLLVSPASYLQLMQPMSVAGTSGSVSVLMYILNNNIAKTQGRDLEIVPSRWCSGAGSSSTDRVLAYVQAKNRVVLDIPVPMSRIMTQNSVERGGAYLTLFMGQIGVVKFRYFQPVGYFDGN